jgi:hypothetical protein
VGRRDKGDDFFAKNEIKRILKFKIISIIKIKNYKHFFPRKLKKKFLPIPSPRLRGEG